MAITVVELRRSRSRTTGGNPLRVYEYMAWDPADTTPDPDAIEAAVDAVAPNSIGALTVESYQQNPKENHQGVFDCTVRYANASKRETVPTGGSEYSFEIGQAGSRITQSLSTINSYGTDPPNWKGGIGWNGERFDGAEIQIPTYSWRETHYKPTADVDEAYKLSIFQCAANPNNSDTFRGFSPGELLFLGATGAPRSADDVAVTFAFAASPNVTGLAVGDITAIAKKGWEYLWVLYEKFDHAAANWLVENPHAVYIEKVYNTSNFATLLEI